MAYQPRTNDVKPGDLVGLFASSNHKFRIGLYLDNDQMAILYERGKGTNQELLKLLMNLKNLNLKELSKIQPKETIKLSAFKRDEYEPYIVNVLDTPLSVYNGNSNEFYKMLAANFKVFEQLKKGDIVKFKGYEISRVINYVFYHHQAIFSDEDRFLIVHKSGEPSTENMTLAAKAEKSLVQENPIMDEAAFRYIGLANIYDNKTPINSPDVIVKKAREKINEKSYNVVLDNCQHFCTDCRYNEKKSSEVNSYALGLSVIGSMVLGVGMGIAALLGSQNSKKKEDDIDEKDPISTV